MTYLIMLLFNPQVHDPLLPAEDPFYKLERWVAQRRWAQRIAALWVLAWLGILVVFAAEALWRTIASSTG